MHTAPPAKVTIRLFLYRPTLGRLEFVDIGVKLNNAEPNVILGSVNKIIRKILSVNSYGAEIQLLPPNCRGFGLKSTSKSLLRQTQVYLHAWDLSASCPLGWSIRRIWRASLKSGLRLCAHFLRIGSSDCLHYRRSRVPYTSTRPTKSNNIVALNPSQSARASASLMSPTVLHSTKHNAGPSARAKTTVDDLCSV